MLVISFAPLLLSIILFDVGCALVVHQQSNREDVTSFCNASAISLFMESFKHQFHREPKVALVVAEQLRFPARRNERLDRWATAVEGADLFVATDPASEDKIQFLPRPTRVGMFNHTYEVSLAASGCPSGRAYQQLLRTGDAMQLVLEQEKAQGWTYDVVARLRTEAVAADICEKGPDQGCYESGTWQREMAVRSLSEDGERAIYIQHDRVYFGRRSEMQELFHQIELYLAERMHMSFTRRLVSEDFAKFPLYELQASLLSQLDCSQIPGEETMHDVATKKLGFVERELGRAVDIRRFGCDYSQAEGVVDRLPGHPEDYAIGCKHYPQVSDATEYKCTA